MADSSTPLKALGNERGLSLIEVTFALLILAGSFTVILSLQSSSVQREVSDRNRQSAMLIARRILAAIETQSAPLEVQDFTTSARDLFEGLVASSPPEDRQELDLMQEFEAAIKVEEWGIPGVEEQPLHRVTLNVYRVGSPRDGVNIIYFVPIDEGEEE